VPGRSLRKLQITTLSGVYYASVTSIIHDSQCCNLLISWPLTRWRHRPKHKLLCKLLAVTRATKLTLNNRTKP